MKKAVYRVYTVDGANAANIRCTNCSYYILLNKQRIMNTDFLNLKIGNNRRLKITKITSQEIPTNNNALATKVVLTALDTNTNIEFLISDAYVPTSHGVQIKGLWLKLQNNKTEIQHGSTLATVLDFYKCKVLKDLLDKEIYVYPDSKNFLILIACNELLNQ